MEMNQKKEEIRAVLKELIGNIVGDCYSVDKEGNIDMDADIQIDPIIYDTLINEFTDLLMDIAERK